MPSKVKRYAKYKIDNADLYIKEIDKHKKVFLNFGNLQVKMKFKL